MYKVFGKQSRTAVERLSDGSHRDTIADLDVTAAVIDVSFEVEPGEIFVVMGLSGSGKSTLIRMLNGLLEPTAGTVEVDGVDITALSKKHLLNLRGEKISMVFQHFALLPHRTVLENAAYGLELRGLPKEERDAKAMQNLEMVGLEGWEHKFPHQLSGGMQQRVGLARALAADTDIILMDEAFSALDPLIRRDMQTQLLELQKSLGKTIVFITHDLNEAMRLGDRICVLRDGRVAQIGTAEEILNEPANEYVSRFIEDVDRTRVLTASSAIDAGVAADPGARQVGAATPIAELYEDMTTADRLRVVSEEGEVLGMVSRGSVLAALAAGKEGQS
ncbi:betaine/proline/choline family ABC transporter ATP-binding protein [Nocardiopsis sp. HNM0947]|uniref:Betaine/proline/choline family ABC transporter ATP-binding protein n=1 Tax=Nocardiopsis coralli TaxID=2772213 RepID=A0ABR9P3B0_9ACTN|nr:betaine/proline/choline family ABC transporter ATP-binding protein [Nocardiopsis coralli]MBE2998319.1 betaine/proline/choline family ABC transporter ATP-binding protein [Nocardiopsis coralli]